MNKEYSTEKLGISQNAMLEDLRDYGLIWQRRVNYAIHSMIPEIDRHLAIVQTI